MSTEFKDLCLDVNDPQRMARFWAPVLGLAEPRGENLRLDDDVEEHAVWLNRVPEVKTVKHRVHLDVHVAGDPGTARRRRSGARRQPAVDRHGRPGRR